MDTILGIPPGESYSGIRALADLSVCVKITNNTPLRLPYKLLNTPRDFSSEP